MKKLNSEDAIQKVTELVGGTMKMGVIFRIWNHHSEQDYEAKARNAGFTEEQIRAFKNLQTGQPVDINSEKLAE
jgi:hypothetical protein